MSLVVLVLVHRLSDELISFMSFTVDLVYYILLFYLVLSSQ